MELDALPKGLVELGLELGPDVVERLTRYLLLIEKWNKVYNLTAIRDMRAMVFEHLLDSLSILPHVKPSAVLDVGSGAGLPGIPIAIARPQLRLTLLDSNRKKAAFLQQALIELELKNAGVVCARAEAFRPAQGFDTVVTRAFAATPTIARLCLPLLGQSGIILAMKGARPKGELDDEQPEAAVLRKIVRLNVPGLSAQRHLLIMTKAS